MASLPKLTIALLEPGGYIQWEDADVVHQFVKGVKAEEFERRMDELFKSLSLDYR